MGMVGTSVSVTNFATVLAVGLAAVPLDVTAATLSPQDTGTGDVPLAITADRAGSLSLITYLSTDSDPTTGDQIRAGQTGSGAAIEAMTVTVVDAASQPLPLGSNLYDSGDAGSARQYKVAITDGANGVLILGPIDIDTRVPQITFGAFASNAQPLSFDEDVVGGEYHVSILDAATAAPDAATVLAAPAIAMTGSGGYSVDLSGEAAGDYRVHVVAVDEFGNVSSVATSPTVTVVVAANVPVDGYVFSAGNTLRYYTTGSAAAPTINTATKVITINSDDSGRIYVEEGIASADQFIEYDVAGGNSNDAIGAWLRLDNPASPTGYLIRNNYGQPNAQGYRFLNGGNAGLSTSHANTQQDIAAYTMRGQIVGSTVTLLQDGLSVLSASNGDVTAANTVAIAFNNCAGMTISNLNFGAI